MAAVRIKDHWAEQRLFLARLIIAAVFVGVLTAVDLVRSLVVSGSLAGVHDVSTGGLAVALAEMAVRSGVGIDVAGVPGVASSIANTAPSVSVRVGESVAWSAGGMRTPSWSSATFRLWFVNAT